MITIIPIYNERIEAAVNLITAVYEESGTGRALHIVIDDWNLTDDHLRYCEDYINTPAERACYNQLINLSVEERASALALYERFT